jgi:hypothetical protein
MGSHSWKLGEDEWYHCQFCPEVVHQVLFNGEDVTLIKRSEAMHGNCIASISCDTHPRVDCCKEGNEYIVEYPNDQGADPGYRHIRLSIQTPNSRWIGNVRIRFCPFCGTEYKLIKTN